MVISHIKDTNW